MEVSLPQENHNNISYRHCNRDRDRNRHADLPEPEEYSNPDVTFTEEDVLKIMLVAQTEIANNHNLSKCLICSKTMPGTEPEPEPWTENDCSAFFKHLNSNSNGRRETDRELSVLPLPTQQKEDDGPKKEFLLALSKMFNISSTIYDTVNLSHIHLPLYCERCLTTVLTAMDVLKEIERLKLKLRQLRCEVKNNLIDSFNKENDNNNYEESDRHRNRNLGERDAHINIRRSFAQCWTPCRINLRGISKRQHQESQPKIKITGSKNNSDPSPSEPTTTPATIATTTTSLQFITDGSGSEKSENIQVSDSDVVAEVETNNTEGNLEGSEIGISLEDEDYSASDNSNISQSQPSTSQEKSKLNQPDDKPDPAGAGAGAGKHVEKSIKKLQASIKKRKRKPSVKPQSNAIRTYDSTGKLLSFKCKHCQETYKREDHNQSPNKKEFSVSCFKNPCCGPSGTTFNRFLSFTLHHQRYCFAKSSEVFQCETCGGNFSSARYLSRHIASVHTKQFNYYCEICGDGFLYESSLSQHALTHSDHKVFQCQFPECSKAYRRKTLLTIHMRSHTQEAPYICQVCGMGFASYGKVRNHETNHVQVKEFPCPICNKLFASKKYVRNHVWATHEKGKKIKPKPWPTPTPIPKPKLPDETLDLN